MTNSSGGEESFIERNSEGDESEHESEYEYEIIVIGGGNGGLSAALSASGSGVRSVLILESSPCSYRGGNSRHTRNLRCAHKTATDILDDTYSEEEYWEDLMQVTGGECDENLGKMVISRSYEAYRWMLSQGVKFQSSLSGTLSLGRTNAFFLGGGKALLNRYYVRAEEEGIEVWYDSEVIDITIKEGIFKGVLVRRKGFPRHIRGKVLIVASGGFEANIGWLSKVWGEGAKNFLIRGTSYNRGSILRMLLDKGIGSAGKEDQFHAVAIDGRSPRFDGGIVTRIDSVPFGIVVNSEGERFYDEGEDFWPKRYAIWGRLIAQQAGQIAYSIIDSKSLGCFMPSLFAPIRAETIEGLGEKLGLPSGSLTKTINNFNRSVRAGTFNIEVLDDCHTEGIEPAKSHWARRVEDGAYYGYPLRPGITFTYLGVKVREDARVMMKDKTATKNIFAAGEIMAGNILAKGYLGGIGMTIGTVFGMTAGKESAKLLNQKD